VALDQAALLQFAKRLDQHFLGDAGQTPMQRAAACGAIVAGMQRVQNHAGPLGGEEFEHASRRAVFTPLFFV